MSNTSEPTPEQIADQIRWIRNDLNRLENGLAMPFDHDAIARKKAQLDYFLTMQKAES